MENLLGVMTLAGLVILGIGLVTRNKTINSIGTRMFFSGASRCIADNKIFTLHSD